jgi:hypothetical protein
LHLITCGKGIPIVIVGELLWRHPNKVGDEYNPKVVDTNVLIRQKLTTGNKDNIFTCFSIYAGILNLIVYSNITSNVNV